MLIRTDSYVALVAVWALIRTRWLPTRAVSAVILLEAMAIAVAAPFVMDSDSESTAGVMSSTGLSSSEYARKADANCRMFGEFAATLGNPKTHAGIERRVDRLMPEFWQSYVAQQALVPPPEQNAKAQQWMHAMAEFGRDQELIRAAAALRDAKGLERANARANADAAESARLSKELGMRVCFQ